MGNLKMKVGQPLAYAIDFGTSNSLIGVIGTEQVLTSLSLDIGAVDPTIFRSLIYFPDADNCFFGMEAISQYINNDMQGRLLRSFKRFLPKRDFVGTYIEDRPLNLENIVGRFLKELKQRADHYLDVEIDQLILGHPARFSLNESEHQFGLYRLERAARIAGFKEIKLVPEPIAALTSFLKVEKSIRTVFCADLGGGTSDFSILQIDHKNWDQFDVLALEGVPVAGDYFDGDIMKYELATFLGSDVEYQFPFSDNILNMPKQFREKLSSPSSICLLRTSEFESYFNQVRNTVIDKKDQICLDRLFTLINDNLGFLFFEEIERCKKLLSDHNTVPFKLNYPNIGVNHDLTYPRFCDYTKETVKHIENTMSETLQQAGLTPQQIDLVCLTGGTAQMPVVQEVIKSKFSLEKIKQYNHYHSVVQGLCLQGI